MTFTATFHSIYFYSLTFYDLINRSHFIPPLISPLDIYIRVQKKSWLQFPFHAIAISVITVKWTSYWLTFHRGKSCWNEGAWVAADVFFSKFLSFDLLTAPTSVRSDCLNHIMLPLVIQLAASWWVTVSNMPKAFCLSFGACGVFILVSDFYGSSWTKLVCVCKCFLKGN